jgi:hypothetical protein
LLQIIQEFVDFRNLGMHGFDVFGDFLAGCREYLFGSRASGFYCGSELFCFRIDIMVKQLESVLSSLDFWRHQFGLELADGLLVALTGDLKMQ